MRAAPLTRLELLLREPDTHLCSLCKTPFGRSQITCRHDVRKLEIERLERIEHMKRERDMQREGTFDE